MNLHNHKFKSTSDSSRRANVGLDLMDNGLKTFVYQFKDAHSMFCKKKSTKSKKKPKHHRKVAKVINNKTIIKCYNNVKTKVISSTTTNLSIFHERFHDTPLFFSASKNIDSSNRQFNFSGCPGNTYKLVSIPNCDDIKIIDTVEGAICINNDTFIFLLVPRKEIVQLKDHRDLVQALNSVQDMDKSINKSIRGKHRAVAFEEFGSKYIRRGIYTPMNMSGLALADTPSLVTECINKYRNQVKNIITQYFPSVVFKSFFNALTQCEVPAYNDIGTYYEEKEKKNKRARTMDKCDEEVKEVMKSSANTKDAICSSHEIFPSFAFGRDSFLCLHKDEDAFLSMTSVHCIDDLSSKVDKYVLNQDVVKYFTFDYGETVSVALRSGDMLFFNPVVNHCISSKTDEYKDKKVQCMSMYLKAKVIGGNDNSKKFRK